MPQSAKEFTEITALIKLILNGYPGNSAIFREYLQNSDDARARLQVNERCHSMESLVDEILKGAQGAALLAINDGILRESDWMALRKINSSSKQTDESQTGKNGLGFRASYHLTENPHIISGRTLMILDPHHEFKEHPGGISIDIVDEGEEYKDQVAPFTNAIDGMQIPYVGTAFRLPLRTQQQADRSKIKTTPTSVQDMVDVLNEFATKELEEVILFLKHITTIEIHHIDSAGNKVSFAKVSIDPPIPVPCPPTLIRRTTVTSFDGTTTSRDWKFHYATHARLSAKALMDSRLGYDIGDNLTTEKLSPTVDIALPLDGSPIRGRLFTLLPFPQYTNFPIHLNAVFALDTSRQNLKNLREVGVASSRERRLVEWNKLIFDTWTPALWADLFAGLSPETLKSSHWSLWPPQEIGEDCYWSGLAAAFVQAVHSRNIAVFPTADFSRVVRVTDPNVLLASSTPGVSLSLLSTLGVDIVQPPEHIFNILISGNYAVSQLSPQSLHRVLQQRTHFEENTDSDLKMVADYLVFSSNGANLKYLSGLRWFRRANSGGRVCLDMAADATGIKYFIPQSETEAGIFVTHEYMLAWDTLTDRLRVHLSSSEASRIVKVATLNPSDVVSFLKRRLMALQSSCDEISKVEQDYEYIIDFWTWIAGWAQSSHFFQSYLTEVSTLFLLPIAKKGSLRKLSSHVICFGESDSQYTKAWGSLGIYPISSRIPDSVVSKLRSASVIPASRSRAQISYLIKNSNIASPSDPNVFADVRMYLFDNLPRSGSSLTTDNKSLLKRFPIFTVKGSQSGASLLGTVDGHCIYVDIGDDFPLPRLRGYPNAIFVDIKDSVTLSLIRLIDNNITSNITSRNQLSLLQLAIDDWDVQLPDSKNIFIDRIFAYRPSQLPSSLLQSLQSLPFVAVNGCNDHRAPINLIHPQSALAALYQGEPGKMPVGRFAEPALLSVMQDFGFVRASLDAHIVQDHLQYLTDPSNSGDPLLFEKATNFTYHLNREWSSRYDNIVKQYHSQKWLPFQREFSAPRLLVSPSQSRDNHRDYDSHPYFFDCVLNPLSATFTPQLRAALGWTTTLSPTVLIAQLVATIDRPDLLSSRSNRLTKLLTYLNHLFVKGNLSPSVLDNLRDSMAGKQWIPTNSLSDFLVETQHGLLSHTSLKDPFQTVYQGLARLPLLRAVGCCDRPPLNLLVKELNGISSRSTLGKPFSSNLHLDSPLAILEEISNNHREYLTDIEIMIPCEDQCAHPLSSVYYRDATAPIGIPATLQGKFAVHGRIPSLLAELLGIPTLSSLLLGDEEDEDEEQMDTDFITVITQFLNDYDPQYAVNEFLANAVDARATRFSLLLDERRYSINEGGTTISPKFQRLLGLETLLLHNDARLTSADFKGIRKVGRGGKRGDTETHGRHGLGALGLYYFTDVATIISGDYVIILDPSSKYLPTLRSGRKRTSLFRKISDIVAQYPGQLARYEALFGFSSQNPRYEGTLFCLPLSATITQKACGLSKTREYIERSYRHLASNALLFTLLESITASVCSFASTAISRLWSFSASRSDDRNLGYNSSFDFHELKISARHGDVITDSSWIITASETGDIPDVHLKTANVLKLTSAPKVQLAINIGAVESETFSGYPFSTVSLPRTTSLPFHINARFAISSNRQDLVLNPADSGGNRDPYTMFNTWLLESLVAPLYLDSLQHIVSTSTRQFGRELKSGSWWLSKCSDGLSQLVAHAFFKALPQSDHQIFKGGNGTWISFPESVFSLREPSQVSTLLDLHSSSFVKSKRFKHIAKLESATVVGPAFVREVLLHNADLLCDGGLPMEDCCSILDYFHDETPLIGLPLLVLNSKEIICIPGISQPPVYFSAILRHRTLFSSSPFIGPELSATALKRLLNDPAINVVALAKDNVIQLIEKELRSGSESRRAQWIRDFWDISYNYLPGPPSISALLATGMPLIETVASQAVSLSHCHPNTVVYINGEVEPVVDILKALKIELIKDGHNSHLRKFLREHFKQGALDNVLQCILAKGVAVLDTLTIESQNKLSGWIHNHLSQALLRWKQDSNSTGIRKNALLTLPIWDIYCNGKYRRGDASHSNLLPSHFPMEVIKPYLKPSTTVYSWSSLLSEFLSFCLERRKDTLTLSPSSILSIVTPPAVITTPTEINAYKRFMEAISQFANDALASSGLTAPDSEGTLRPAHELYDDNTDLFCSTLKLTSRPSFLHASFSQFKPQFRALGLIHEITLETFRHCAHAVSDAIREHGPGSDNWNIVRQMSSVAFSVYQSQVPSLMLLTRYSSWTTLDQISFVQRKAERRQGASYHIRDDYVAETLPLILPPSRFVLPAHEPIAWTQRALFLTEPIDGLVTVNKTLGIPEAREVVAHLVSLTTVIAIDHPGDPTLLSDIKATYTWLQNHISDARAHLRQVGKKKLFLNVVDPTSESWAGNWASADELVLNMEYDQSPLKYVRGLLKPFEALLSAAGCEEIKTSVGKASPSSAMTSGQSWKAEFDRMRKSNEFTDVTLVPTSERLPAEEPNDEDDDETVLDENALPTNGGDKGGYDEPGGVRIETSELRAHRVILAVAIPHLRTLQQWKTTAKVSEISFYGSAFAAKAVIDFVYTGEIELSKEKPGKDDLVVMMHSLLEVLPVADEWDMQDLKERVQWELVSKHRVVQRLPEEYDTLLDYATRYNADKIAAELKELEPIRAKMQRLREAKN